MRLTPQGSLLATAVALLTAVSPWAKAKKTRQHHIPSVKYYRGTSSSYARRQYGHTRATTSRAVIVSSMQCAVVRSSAAVGVAEVVCIGLMPDAQEGQGQAGACLLPHTTDTLTVPSQRTSPGHSQ